MSGRAAALLLVVAVPCTALAGRPDTGGDLFSFDEADVLDFVDGPAGVVRVHFSVDGPNETLLRDDDASGHPDFAEQVAATAEDVLDRYAEEGFRRPLAESEVGLDPLGGSDAFDFYLLDYGGSADGQFAVDGCADGVCAGHMLMENDFRGYGYGSLSEAIRVLTSHELFHAVQAAYVEDLPVWLSEGTAVWAERLYDPSVDDFLWFASRYLDDTGRSIDRPPAGPVPAFAYGTCLFWEFLSERLGVAAIVALMQQSTGEVGLDAVELALVGESTTLRDEWTAFTEANLSTGPRADAGSFYPFAAEVDGLQAKSRGTFVHDDNRFYPLAATYYFLEHPGGDLWFATPDEPAGLVLSVVAVDGSGERAPLGETVASWSPTQAGAGRIASGLARGDYWLRGTYPERAAQSRKIDFCLGREQDVEPCRPPEPDAGVDAGLDAGLDAATDAATEAAPAAWSAQGGCSIATTGTSASAAWRAGIAALLGLWAFRARARAGARARASAPARAAH